MSNIVLRNNLAYVSFREEGKGRICFNNDNTTFQGILISPQDEVYSLCGTKIDADGDAATSTLDGDYEITVIDSESATQYALNTHLVADPSTGHCIISSDAFKFTTEEILVGNRAAMEIQSYMSPDMATQDCRVHVGHMSVNIQTHITPSRSFNDSNNTECRDDSSSSCADFLK